MSELSNLAFESVNHSKTSFCKFISANDAGKTGAHQEGFYIPKNSIPLIFDRPGIKGENKDRFITIKWQNDFTTNSRFIYYGKGSRNEYRLTRFGRGFPYLTDDNVGDLFILSHIEGDYYEGYILQNDDDIEDFFAALNLSPNETNRLIDKQNIVTAEVSLTQCFDKYINQLNVDFPPTIELASCARECYKKSYGITLAAFLANPDNELLHWLETEYQLFKSIENKCYDERIKTPFTSVEELVTLANTILNRRKSRAGKSLEHHLSEIFKTFNLKFESQVITEDNKRPDFIFPDINSYHNRAYEDSKLIFLASKTTCKDRWRQILNEADRIKEKHLFTLQPGISNNQLIEMYKHGVRLVVPKPNIKDFPENFRENILSLDNFIKFVEAKQN